MGRHTDQLLTLIFKDLKNRRRNLTITFFETFMPVVLLYVFVYLVSTYKESIEKVSTLPDGWIENKIPSSFEGEIFYSPVDRDPKRLMDQFAQDLNGSAIPRGISVQNLQLVAVNYSKPAILFKAISFQNSILNYTIRPFVVQFSPPQDLEGSYDINYWHSFVTLQWLLSRQFLKNTSANPIYKMEPSFQSFIGGSKPNVRPDQVVKQAVTLALILGNFVHMLMAGKRVILEKEIGCRELLRLTGVPDRIYWESQFVNYFYFHVVHAVLATFIICNVKDFENAFRPSQIFVVVLTYFVSSLFFTFTLASLITKPIFFRIAISIFSFGSAMGGLELTNIRESAECSHIQTTLMLPSSVLKMSFCFLLNPEKVTLTQSWIIFGIAANIIFYSLTTLYTDSICPWQNGTIRPWYYPIYYFFDSVKAESDEKIRKPHSSNKDMIIEESTKAKPLILCRALTKIFGNFGLEKRAVNQVFLDINEAELTVLLGPNGAGKTSLMSLITGFLNPSAGKVYINGIDVHRYPAFARRSISLFPQHQILFKNLTVYENLYFFASVKGLSATATTNVILRVIDRLRLEENINYLPSRLTPSLRRRVQLAATLVTQSEILILDEPTTGLDADMRKLVWEYLVSLKRTHTLLVSTQSIDEADAIGDRIVIMSEGKIKCTGSPEFLKSKFGAGYMIRMIKKNYNHSVTSSIIQVYFPQAIITSVTSIDVSFLLGGTERSSSDFSSKIASLCYDLDAEKQNCGISSYSISMTTLEDVFLKVSAEDGLSLESKKSKKKISSTESKITDVLHYSKIKGLKLCTQQFRAILCKRFCSAQRDLLALTHSLILPTFFLLVLFNFFLVDFTLVAKTTYYSPKTISPTLYETRKKVFAALKTEGSFKECFKTINANYKMDLVTAPISLEIYLAQNQIDAQKMDSEFLFGIQESSKGITLLYSSTASYSLPISLDVYLNSLKCSFLNTSLPAFSVDEQPLPTRPNVETYFWVSTISQLTLAIVMPIPLSFLAASYYALLASEDCSKVKLLQKIAGIGSVNYWLSNFYYDMIFHVVAAIPMTIVLVVSNLPLLSTGQIIVAITLLLISSGFSAIPIAYLLTFLKLDPSSGFTLIEILYGVIGVFCSLLYVLAVESPVARSFLTGFNYWKWLMELLPVSAFTIGVSKLFKASRTVLSCPAMKDQFEVAVKSPDFQNFMDMEYIERFCLGTETPDHIDLILPEIWSQLIVGFTAIILTRYLEEHKMSLKKLFASCCVLWKAPPLEFRDLNEDIIREDLRVREILKDNNLLSQGLVVSELTKDYTHCFERSVRAVDSLSFAVHKKECFGLLGPNEAGKTTTMSMLVGDLSITKGDAFVENFSVKTSPYRYRERISYCPEFDALPSLLDPSETLTLFARLKGIPESKIQENVAFFMKSTGLKKYRHFLNKDLSSGNKRKLSLAIAIIGEVSTIFLDEPTTGVDPASRKMIWATLVDIRETGQSSIVISSHSIDECEVLCSRIGIMAKGTFKGLGSAEYLKEKFGRGYILTIKLSHNSYNSRVDGFILEAFAGAVLLDDHATILQYHLTDPTIKWGDIFRKMGQAQQNFPIEDFKISETSIGQVLFSFMQSRLKVD